jgi:hypothetical protein
MALLKVKSHEVASCFNCEGFEALDVLKNEIDRAILGHPTLAALQQISRELPRSGRE